jgi:hypothetical protein
MCQSADVHLSEHVTNKFEASSLVLVRQGNYRCQERHLEDTDKIPE